MLWIETLTVDLKVGDLDEDEEDALNCLKHVVEFVNKGVVEIDIKYGKWWFAWSFNLWNKNPE